MKNIKDIQTARNWIKDNGHSFDHKGKNFRIYQYKGNPNNIRPSDLIEAKDHKKDYETFVQLYTKINKAVDDASKELNKITSKNKDRMGLIDPKIKSSSKYKRAKAQYDKTDDLRKRFLRGVPKDFMRKYTFEDKNPRIPRKPGQKAGSDKHSDLYTDENPRGTIHGLGFTDSAKAKQSVSKIRNSGKTHAHKMQAAIAMSQRAKVASQRAKDPEKKKNLGQAHKIYQSYIDTNKKNK